jgi:pyruvate/2-oxoacid:ferredoxin oxidoreductase alpha subunit
LTLLNTQNTEELLAAINLLAGAAQAGAKGILAQAAFNVMKASEAVAKAKGLDLDQSIQDAARSVLNEAQSTLLNASQIPGAMDEAKQDIIAAKQKPYQIAAKL